MRGSGGTSKDYSLLQVVAVDQSSALQVETHGTNLATGGLQEQIESDDWSEETADTQRVAHLPQVRRSCGTSEGYSLLQQLGGDETNVS